MEFKLHEAEALVGMFGGDAGTSITVTEGGRDGAPGHSGPGLYAHCTEYPEEGSVFLSEADDPNEPEDPACLS